jgi:crotonobetaine/carnitine-CoA ligase
MSGHRTLGALVAERASTHEHSVFVDFGQESVTYGEFDALVTRAAQGLAALGVKHGDRVCIALPNCLEFLAASFGTMRLGGILVPLSLEYRGPQVEYVLADADAQVIVTSPDFFRQHQNVLDASNLAAAVLTGAELPAGTRLHCLAWNAVLETSQPDADLPEVSSSDALAIIYTSGTTGDPKGVQLSHEHELTLAENIAASTSLSGDDCFYNFYPLHHNTGLGIITFAVLAAGARMLLTERFSKSSFWPDVIGHGCTVFYGMGPIIEILDKDETAGVAARGHSLRVCFGIAIGDRQAKRFTDRFGVQFVGGYGSTEVNMVAIAPIPSGHPGAAGKILDDFEVAVLDSHDRPVPPGEVGEIVVRPRRPFITGLGYWRKPAETARAWRNLWAHTGDAGRIDADGYLYFVDRINDVIRHRGNNVSSLELETLIVSLDGVAEAAVIPVASGLGEFDQDICVLVVPQEGRAVDPQCVIDLCAAELPRYAVPRYIEFVPELPKTSTGKVRKAVLRAAPPAPDRWDRESQAAAPTGAGEAGPQ